MQRTNAVVSSQVRKHVEHRKDSAGNRRESIRERRTAVCLHQAAPTSGLVVRQAIARARALNRAMLPKVQHAPNNDIWRGST